jgi:hypothetical protein
VDFKYFKKFDIDIFNKPFKPILNEEHKIMVETELKMYTEINEYLPKTIN